MQLHLDQMCLERVSSSTAMSTPVSENWNPIPDPDSIEGSGRNSPEANFHHSELGG